MLSDPASALIFPSSAEDSLALSREVKSGRARRLAHGIYTRDLSLEPARLLRAHFLDVTAHFYPGAVIADRSVPRAGPDDEGFLFVVHDRRRPLRLPGLTLLPRRGAPPMQDDLSLPQGLWLASRPRALLENLRRARTVKGRPRRTLTRVELHDWVARLLRTEGRDRLNELRDRARELAPLLGLEDVFPELDDLIGAALGTRQVETGSAALSAAQAGWPYDERRDAAFRVLAKFLAERAPSPRPVLVADRPRWALFPFFDAYFSNFIEGTEFTVDEARAIVFEGRLSAERPADAHDVLGTYRVLADEAGMRQTPRSPDDFLDLLRARHARILEGRPEKRPGEFKLRANRAGSTEFVAPDLVRGTLARGFEILRTQDDPFVRAVLMMFIVSEVHPFDDGNGRVARVMMNAELQAQDEHRILIPTVYRNEYLSGLRAMTHNQNPRPLVRVLEFAQRYAGAVDFSSFEDARRVLTETNAFVDPNEALARGIRLTLPSLPAT